MGVSSSVRCNKCYKTMHIVGEGKVSAVFKCSKCGYSVTVY